MRVRPFVVRFQVRPFVILFVERSGSTYLLTALKSQDDILALTEKFEVLRKEGKGAAEQLTWANSFLTAPLVGRHRAIGFKTKLVDVPHLDAFAALLRQRGCRIIQLHRQNTVKAVISTINARRQWKASGSWNLLRESNRLPPFAVDPAEFEMLLQQRQRLDAELAEYVRRLRLPTLRLVYEDLLKDEAAFVGRTLSFLTGRQQLLHGQTLKNTVDDLRQAIVNLDDLRRRYAGTPFEPMFDEVLVAA